MTDTASPRPSERWAHLRFSIIGPLLAAPPPPGQLKSELTALAEKTWRHPISGQPCRFAFSTIERWYLRARRQQRDPVSALKRKVRSDAGRQKVVTEAVQRALLDQYAAHKSWTCRLHYDNLTALAKGKPELAPLPSYSTVRRFMIAQGLVRRPRGVPAATPPAGDAPRPGSSSVRCVASRPNMSAPCGTWTSTTAP